MKLGELVPNESPLSWNKEQGKRFWLWAAVYIYTLLLWVTTKIIKDDKFSRDEIKEITHHVIQLWYSQRTLAANKKKDNETITNLSYAIGFILAVIPMSIIFPAAIIGIIIQASEVSHIIFALLIPVAVGIGILVGIHPFAEGFNFLAKKKGDYIHRYVRGPGIVATSIIMLLGVTSGILGTYFIYFIVLPPA